MWHPFRKPNFLNRRVVRSQDLSATSAATASLSLKLKRGGTGRTAEVLRNDEATEYASAQELIASIYSEQGIATDHPLAERLRKELGALRQQGLADTYYRARPFPIETVPLNTEFGPPPDGRQKSGRFGEGGGESILYLATDAETCSREVRAEADDALWIQEVRLDAPDLWWVSLHVGLEAETPLLHNFMIHSELKPDPTSAAPNFRDPYRATQYLADACRELAITAIGYPSVQGGSQHTGSNLVLLRPGRGAVPVGSPTRWKTE